MTGIGPLVVSLVVSWVLTALLVRYVPRLGLMDQPDERRVHTTPTPRGGGLAIYVACAVGALVFGQDAGLLHWVLGLGAGIVILGLVDDWRPLPWQVRLGVEAGIAALVVTIGPVDGTWLHRAVALFWIVALINAFNMLDNMDALSAGVAAIAALFVGFTNTALADWPFDSHPGAPHLLFVGALVGFLWFNHPPARIFMGDAGSTFLGFFVGVYSVPKGNTAAADWRVWAVPITILAVAWYDMTSVVALRLWQGRSPFHGDKQHLSHRLVSLGLTSSQAVAIIHLLAVVSGVTGLLLSEPFSIGPNTPWLAFQFICWWCAVAAVEYFPYFRRAGPIDTDTSSAKVD